MKAKKCRYCGIEFLPLRSIQAYCSIPCSNRAKNQPCKPGCVCARHKPSPKRRKEKKCPECGTMFRPHAPIQTCCSKSCGTKRSRRRRRPKRYASWQGALARKGEADCRVCGATASHLHHIVPRSLSPGEAKADWQENGLPLCAHCHLGWHSRSVTIYRESLRPHEVEAAAGYASEAWLDRNYPKRNRGEEVDLVVEVGLQEAGERYETADLLDDSTGG